MMLALLVFVAAQTAEPTSAEPAPPPAHTEDTQDPATTPPLPIEAAPPPPPPTPTAAPGAPFDEGAEAIYAQCKALVDKKDVDGAHKCFMQLVVTKRGTEAALKAEAALFIMDAKLLPSGPLEAP